MTYVHLFWRFYPYPILLLWDFFFKFSIVFWRLSVLHFRVNWFCPQQDYYYNRILLLQNYSITLLIMSSNEFFILLTKFFSYDISELFSFLLLSLLLFTVCCHVYLRSLNILCISTLSSFSERLHRELELIGFAGLLSCTLKLWMGLCAALPCFIL